MNEISSTPTATPTGTVSSPIADLSYRNYDGPLNPPSARWWVIARTMTQQVFRNRLFWVYTVLSTWYYLVMFAIIFFAELSLATIRSSGGGGGPINVDFLRNLIWKNQYLHGFGFGQLIFLFVALTVGAGAIANDNRANAMLVYLSKPCTKADYVIGKFMGVFLPIFTAMALPSTLFFLYGALSYRAYGFVADPSLFPRVLLAIGLGAALHSALILAISALLQQGRVAGTLYAALYLITNLFTQLMVIAWNNAEGTRPWWLQYAFYGSIDGAILGLTRAILGTSGGNVFGFTQRTFDPIPAPPLVPILGIVLGIIALSMFIVWRRVRAVEVVR